MNIRYVFLDREGILNSKPPEGQHVASWEPFQILSGIEQAVARLNQAGCTVTVVTNQRGVRLGDMTRADIDEIHERLRQHLTKYGAHLDAIYLCPHDMGQCHCRKRDIGLIEQAFSDFPGARPGNSGMIGDPFLTSRRELAGHQDDIRSRGSLEAEARSRTGHRVRYRNRHVIAGLCAASPWKG